MKNRCPSAKFYSKAVLKGYRLDFPVWSKRWRGGAAGIIPDKKTQVEGIVYEISKEDFVKLDKFEGVKDKRYYKGKVKVILSNGNKLETLTYFPNIQEKKTFKPSKKYLMTIRTGAIDRGLSEQFIKYLDILALKSCRTNKECFSEALVQTISNIIKNDGQ